MKCKIKSIFLALPVLIITAGSLFYLDIALKFFGLYYGVFIWFYFLFLPFLGSYEEFVRSKLLYLTLKKHKSRQQNLSDVKNRALALGVLYSTLESGVYIVPMALHYELGMVMNKNSEVGRTILAMHDIGSPFLVFLYLWPCDYSFTSII